MIQNNTIHQFSSPIRMVNSRHGYMFYNAYDTYVGKSIEHYGEYCQHEIDLFQIIIKPNFVVYEIGANIGSQAPALSSMVKFGSYIGFEPQIELFKILTANLLVNGHQNSIPLNMAIGDFCGTINIPPVDYNHPNNFGSVSLIDRGDYKTNGLAVEIRTIDSLNHLPDPDFIKIDVEGMEISVLKGGALTIERKKPFIYIENDRIEKSADLIHMLWGHGYKLYWHITPYFNDDIYYGNKTNVFKNLFSFNMLCIHPISGIEVNGLDLIVNPDVHPLKANTINL